MEVYSNYFAQKHKQGFEGRLNRSYIVENTRWSYKTF
jgi:hypothetical protein